MKRYAVVIEKAPSNYSAHVPDLPGCIATGYTLEETEQQIREAIEFHIEGLRDGGVPVPESTSVAISVDVEAEGMTSDPDASPDSPRR